MPFIGSDNESDTIFSRLGMKISQQLSDELNLELYNSRYSRNRNYKVIISENKNSLLLETSQKFFKLPTQADESEFNKQYCNSVKPDYYITGKYKLDSKYSKLSLYNIYLQSDPLNLENKIKIPINSVSEIPITPSDKEEIVKLHTISLEEVCAFLAMDIKTKDLNELVFLDNFLLMDTRLTSPFSRMFKLILQQKLVDFAGMQILAESALSNETPSAKYKISGTFWEEGGSLKINMELKNTENNKIIASSVRKIPLIWFESNKISIKPDNFETAKQNDDFIKKNEVRTSGGLLLEINTNKGKDNLLFSKGELLKLSVKANMECYVRFIYYFTDGNKVLLLDNYHILPENLNKWIELPNQFECAEPFGVELMMASAQQMPFEPLNIQLKNGYKFIMDDMITITKTTHRGFIEKKQFSEIGIPITTTK
ncbi:MAG: hypothetical protein PHP52_10980 [Bacteroidales bacterium]|nr:hypothetical protein [Bacteroidales bacterium]